MPIRFRCAYCNQLMGIARRKAGTVVRCPRCAGQVIVPNPEGEPSPRIGGAAPQKTEPRDPSQPSGGAGPMIFEQSDFEQLFSPPTPVPELMPPSPSGPATPAPPAYAAAPPPAPPASTPPPTPRRPQSDFDVEPVGGPFPEAASETGILLTPAKITLIAVLVVLLLGLAFFLGLLVGRS